MELPTKNHLEVVIQEIIQDKIYLDASGNLAVAADASPDLTPMEDAGPNLDDL